MKQLINEFLDLLSNSVIVICLVLSSFLLLINVYHYNDLKDKYYSELEENATFNKMRNKITELDNEIKAINTDRITDQNKKMIAKSAEGQLTKCISLLKESKLYNAVNKEFISYKDIYDFNDELSSDIQNQCLFLTDYNIEKAIDAYRNINNDFGTTSKLIGEKRTDLLNRSNYIRNRLLANSSYSFTTDITRNSTFNEVSETLNLTVFSYNSLVETVNYVVDWYTLEMSEGRRGN